MNYDIEEILKDMCSRIQTLEKRLDAMSNGNIFRSKEMREAIQKLIEKYSKEKQIKNKDLWIEIYKKFSTERNVNIWHESLKRGVSKLQTIEDLGLLNIFRVYVEDYLGESVEGEWQNELD